MSSIIAFTYEESATIIIVNDNGDETIKCLELPDNDSIILVKGYRESVNQVYSHFRKLKVKGDLQAIIKTKDFKPSHDVELFVIGYHSFAMEYRGYSLNCVDGKFSAWKLFDEDYYFSHPYVYLDEIISDREIPFSELIRKIWKEQNVSIKPNVEKSGFVLGKIRYKSWFQKEVCSG